MTRKGKKQLSMYLDEYIHDDMKLVADKLDMSMIELIVAAFNEYKFKINKIQKSQVVNLDGISIQLSVIRDRDFDSDYLTNMDVADDVTDQGSHNNFKPNIKSKRSQKSEGRKNEIANTVKTKNRIKSTSSADKSAKNKQKLDATKVTNALGDFIGDAKP